MHLVTKICTEESKTCKDQSFFICKNIPNEGIATRDADGSTYPQI